MTDFGVDGDARYRTVEEPRIVEMLLLYCWPYEIRGSGRESTEREAQATLDRWVKAGLPFAHSIDKGRCFDPAEVVNFFKWTAIQKTDPFWEQQFVPTTRRLVLEFHGRDTADIPPSPATLPRQQFAVTLHREFNLENCEPGRRVSLRLPLPIEDGALGDLKLVPWSPPGVAVEFSAAPGRLDARLTVPNERKVTLGAQLSFTAHPTVADAAGAPLSPPDRELYTRPREGLIQISPRIRTLADELGGTEQAPQALLGRFWSFIRDRFVSGVLHYDELADTDYPLDWPLERTWLDCQVGAALLIALLRARHIPARLVSGYLLYSVYPGFHYWAEAWIEQHGWVPVDLLSIDLSARGRDAAWRDYFVGKLEYRMKTQCLPRIFHTTPTVRLPPVWYRLDRADGDAMEIGIYDNATSAVVYRDRIVAKRMPPTPPASPV